MNCMTVIAMMFHYLKRVSSCMTDASPMLLLSLPFNCRMPICYIKWHSRAAL